MKLGKDDDTNAKEDDVMAVLAKPTNKVALLKVDDIKSFVDKVNRAPSSKEFKEERERAGRLFKSSQNKK